MDKFSGFYYLINYCTDWARTGVMLFCRLFDFHDVIYHIQYCNVDNRRSCVVLTINGRLKRTLEYALQSRHELREILTL